ncbi:MAG: ATP-dependent Clp protease ATP-binding subunit [bacterium]|nr:ATP-dependent Clp protease ATP-binding subunit [bacterium]
MTYEHLELASPNGGSVMSKTRSIEAILTADAKAAIEEAQKTAEEAKHAAVNDIHLFVGLLTSTDVHTVFMRLGIEFTQIQDAVTRRLWAEEAGQTIFGSYAKGVLADAVRSSVEAHQASVSGIEIFSAVYVSSNFLQDIFDSIGVTKTDIECVIDWVRVNERLRSRYEDFRTAAMYKPTKNMDRAMTAVATPFLDKVSHDLTRSAVRGALPFLVGREREMENLLRSIEGGRQSIVLVGERGVGKEAIVAGLAELMVEERVPVVLQDKRLVVLDIPVIVSSAGGNGAEERLLYAMREVAMTGNVVVVIPNIDQLVGTERGVDLAAVLASELDKGYTFAICTTTTSGYSAKIERSVLGSKLATIAVDEPDDILAIRVIQSQIGAIENTHKVVFTYQSVRALVELSRRYIHESFLPEKAITLAREVALKKGKTAKDWVRVAVEDIAELITEKTHIPVEATKEEEKALLLNLEERMHGRVIGQEEAVKAVAAALRRARADLRSDGRPIANFLFLGPTGVGKTELAKTTAEAYFGSEDAMIRFDMSEYQESTSVYKLIGDTGNGGLLTESVRKRPFAIVLLDELEKAHPDILNLFLQVMDDGRLTDGAGRTIDFTNVILVATSNAGSAYIQDAVKRGDSSAVMKEHLLEEELKGVYRPEFLNRFDGGMVFKPLSEEDVIAITYLMLRKVTARLEIKGIQFRASDDAVYALAKKGYDPKFGARPLRRVIQDDVDTAIADVLLREDVKRRDTIVLEQDGVHLERAETL